MVKVSTAGMTMECCRKTTLDRGPLQEKRPRLRSKLKYLVSGQLLSSGTNTDIFGLVVLEIWKCYFTRTAPNPVV